MKLLSKITLASILSITMLFGVGMAAWVFNTGATSDSQNINVQLTASSTSAGTVTFYTDSACTAALGNVYLIMDQNHEPFLSTTQYDSAQDTGGTTYVDGLYNARLQTVYVKYAGADANLTIASATFTPTETLTNNGTYFTKTDGSIAAASLNGSTASAAYTLPTFTWSTGKPTNTTQYAALQSAGITLAITVAAEVA